MVFPPTVRLPCIEEKAEVALCLAAWRPTSPRAGPASIGAALEIGHPGRGQTHESSRLLSDSGKGRMLTGIWATSHRALGILVQPPQAVEGCWGMMPSSLTLKGRDSPEQGKWSVVICSGRHNKTPGFGWLKQQQLIFLQFGRLEVQNQGAGMVVF